MTAPAADFPAPCIWQPHRVYYGETDSMGVVYYANYLHWFEIGRNTYIRERGLTYREIEDRGIFLPVTRMECRYLAPATFDQEIFIRAGIKKWGRASLVFAYEITDKDKQKVLTKGFTEHACVNSSSRPTRAPDWLKEL
ncbi:MAG: acyl-CoA thioesterase [Desulfonatronovibrionaceae bacterium]